MRRGRLYILFLAVLAANSLVPVIEIGMAAEPAKLTIPEIAILEDQQVSIADLHEVPLTEASGNVYVITDEDIRHSGATDIPTLLRRIPGIEVMQMTGADFNVSVRGDNQVTANKLLVLVDGRSIYEDSFGSVFWTLLPVTLPEIKRIEVLKGPASAIYGFNAFDGVINIITKSPAEMKGSTNGTLLQFGGGEFGTITSSAVQAGTYDKLGYRLSVGHDQANQWRDRNQLALRANKFNVLTEYALPEQSKLAVSGGLVDSNRFDGQVFDVIHEKSTITNGYANVEYRRPDFFVRTNWTRWSENRQELADLRMAPFILGVDRDGNVNEIYKQDVYNLEAQHALAIGSTNRFTYGFNYRHNAVSLNVIDQFTRENRVGLYFQDEWHATKTVTVVAGLRYDMHTEINPTYSPRIALIYKPVEDHAIRVARSVAYRPPTVIETHSAAFFQFPTFGGFTESTVGSKNLEPESITSYEVGYQGWYLKHRLRLRADMFYNHLSNFITVGGTPIDPTTFTFSYANFGKVDLYGGEAGVEFLATSWLTGFANYSFVNLWQSTELLSPAQGAIATRGAPPYKANAGLRGEWNNGWSGEIVVHHVAAASYPVGANFAFFATLAPPLGGAGTFMVPDSRVGSYTLLNLRGAYQFWHEKAEVAVSVFNALNDQHRENPVGDQISSRVMGWLTIKY
jgi:iron complex outermembrane receptor protein